MAREKQKQTARKSVPDHMSKQERRISLLAAQRDARDASLVASSSSSSDPSSRDPQRVSPLAAARDARDARAAPNRAPERPKRDRVLAAIRRYQRTSKLLLPRLPFKRVVRDTVQKITREQNVEMKMIQSLAVDALQEAAETFLVQMFDDANMAAIHARRVTIMPKDVDLVRRIRRDL